MPPAAGQLGVSCQTPMSVDAGTENCGGDEPSPTRAAIISAAAACPVEMPRLLALPSGIAASAAAYRESRPTAAGK